MFSYGRIEYHHIEAYKSRVTFIWQGLVPLQCAHQDFASGSHRAPLQKNRGPVRMLEGQRLKVTHGP